jgi:hypothetical protein
MKPLILPFQGVLPKIAPGAYVAPNATVIGDVEVADGASLWFGVVVRGDVNAIRIGPRTNVQDGTIVHAATGTFSTHIGAEVTIGHAAVIHACRLETRAFIGIKAVILDGAVVGRGRWSRRARSWAPASASRQASSGPATPRASGASSGLRTSATSAGSRSTMWNWPRCI